MAQIAALKSTTMVVKASRGKEVVVPPGSDFFPPFLPLGGGGSPVVFELVKDVADDERVSREQLCVGAQTRAEGEHGWHGLKLYR